MAESKVVTNPVSLSANDCHLILQGLSSYGAVLQRRINNERNPSIRSLLQIDVDILAELRVRMGKVFPL